MQRTENEYLEDLNLRRNEELGKLQREAAAGGKSTRARRSSTCRSRIGIIFVSTAVDITEAVLEDSDRGGAAGDRRFARPDGARWPRPWVELAAQFGCELHGDPTSS